VGVLVCVCRRRKIDEGSTAQRQVQSPIHQCPSEVENPEERWMTSVLSARVFSRVGLVEKVTLVFVCDLRDS